MNRPLETIEYKGFKIDVYQDEDPPNPRENDNLGTMLCKHGRYDLGDVKESKDMSAEEIVKYAERKDVLSLALYLYDHSGLYLRSSRNGNPWYNAPLPQGHAHFDSGLVGFIVVTKDKILKEYSKKKMSKALTEKVLSYLESEVEVYADYLNGNCYGYIVREFEDSCWGFIGGDHEKSGLLEYARNAVDCGITQVNEEKEREVNG